MVAEFRTPEWWKDDPFDNVVEARKRFCSGVVTSGNYHHLEAMLHAERRVSARKLETATLDNLKSIQAEISLIDRLLGIKLWVKTKEEE